MPNKSYKVILRTTGATLWNKQDCCILIEQSKDYLLYELTQKKVITILLKIYDSLALTVNKLFTGFSIAFDH